MKASKIFFFITIFIFALLTPCCKNENKNNLISTDTSKKSNLTIETKTRIDTNVHLWKEISQLENKIPIIEKWEIFANDGNGQAVILLHENHDLSFIGWDGYDTQGKWEYVNKKCDYIKFVFNDPYEIWHETIAWEMEHNNMNSLKVKYADTLNNTIIFKIDTINSRVYIDFFGYCAYRNR